MTDLRSDEAGQKEAHLQGVYANANRQGKRQDELEICSWSPNHWDNCGGTAHMAERF